MSEVETHTHAPTEAWAPKVPLDLTVATGKAFEAAKAEFEKWTKTEPVDCPLGLTDGWHTLTPQDAEDLLRRNRPGANRKASLSTIQYYAAQMRRGSWPATGQPVIFDEHGVLVDGQHRLWACMYSSTSFTTYVVTNVKAVPHLFAYIDNGRARSPAVALQTSGMNGVSPTIVAIINIANAVEAGAYSPTSVVKSARHSPIEYLNDIERYPNAAKAARLASSDYQEVVTTVSHKDVVGYMLMAVMDRYGQEVADEFFLDLADVTQDFGPKDAITELRALFAADHEKQNPMKRHQVLGNMIRAFNNWYLDVPMKKRWHLAVHEDFPVFVDRAEPVAEEASVAA